MDMDIFIKNAMLRVFYFFLVICIFGATKTNARKIDPKDIQLNTTFPAPAHNQSKAEEMCNKYIRTAQSCKASVPRSNSTSDSIYGNVGGRKELLKEYPHMALLGINETWVCGGSLISEKFVLTAAQCTSTLDYAANARGAVNKIRLGELYLASTRGDARIVDYPVTDKFIHPNYSFPWNDIALFKFEGLTSFSDYIRPICLNTLYDIPELNFTALRWGKLHSYSRGKRDNLLSVDLYPENDPKCKSEYLIFENSTMICAGYVSRDKSICRRDSGGPLQIVKENPECPEVPIYTQIGITSYVYLVLCDLPSMATGFTRVSHFIPWIESIVWK